MRISGTTTVCGVIGNPVAHSLSPRMHNAAYEAMGLDFTYVAFRVETVERAIMGVRGFGIRGLSVTIPHKIAVMEYLDEIDGLAKQIGAVNTVVNDNGRLLGANTDAHGILHALATKESPDEKSILILGAGGAARAAVFALACLRNPKEIILAALDQELDNAKKIAEEASQASKDRQISTVSFDPPVLRQAVKRADILINATPVGMHPNVDQSPIPEDWLNENHLAFDMIYNPLETKLLRDVRNRSGRTVRGIPMFVHQGAEQFRMWTGAEAPIDVMERAVLYALQNE